MSSAEFVRNLSVKELKCELSRRSISYAGCVEKSDLRRALLRAILADEKGASGPSAAYGSSCSFT